LSEYVISYTTAVFSRLGRAMYREEVVAKALREHREKLSSELTRNRSRQKELVEHLAEHQLAIRTLSTLVHGRAAQAQPVAPALPPPERLAAARVPESVQEPSAATAVEVPSIQIIEKRGYSRDKLKIVAFPFMQARFGEEPFEVSKVRDLLDEIETEVTHTYEAAWNLCNDLLRDGKLKQAAVRNLPKGIVRLFVLRDNSKNHRPAAQQSPALAGR